MLDLEFLNQLDPDVHNTLLRLLLTLLALLLIWLLRRSISRLLLKPLRKIVIHHTTTHYDNLLLDIIEKPISLIIIALGILLAENILTVDATATQFFDRLSRSFIIAAVFLALYNAVDLIIASSLRLQVITGIRVDEQLVPFMRVMLKVAIIAIGVTVVLQEWNYDVNGFVAGLGLSGLAFSLAAKDTVANLFAFTTIVSDQPFRVGEYIKTPAVEGTVEDVGIRNIRLRQPDQAYVTVPNATITSAPILNWSRLTKRRINFNLRLSYGITSQQMRDLLNQLRNLLKDHPAVEDDSVVVLFTDLSDKNLTILVRCYIEEPDWARFSQYKQDINLQIMDLIESMDMTLT